MSFMKTFAACSAAIILSLGGLAAEPAHITIGGKERTYFIERPPGQAPRPTIVMLHGLHGNGAAAARGSGLDRLAPQNGLVAVFPDRIPQLQGWNFFPPGREHPLMIERTRAVGGPPDDVGFLKALVADLVRRGISDPKRIYLAGGSNGSFMALRTICADTGIFAAVGLLTTGMPDMLGDECRPAKPVPVMILNGTADTTVPYGGGLVQPSGNFSVWSTNRLVLFLRRLNGCAEGHEQSVLPNTGATKVETERWASCAGGPVVLYRAIGAGHDLPASVNNSQLLLDFFRGKARSDVVLAQVTAPSQPAAPVLPQGDAERLMRECDRLAGFLWDSDRGGGTGPLIVSIDTKAAMPACLAAAKVAPEDARTVYQLGRALRADRKFEDARRAYELADSLGARRAAMELGILHERGLGGKRDLAEARRLYEKAARVGLILLGALYENGLGVPKDMARANSLYDEDIMAGPHRGNRPYAQFLTGWLYHGGELGRDYVEAKKWFEKAAAGGNPLAMRNLGIIHEEGGHGLTRDLVTAERWYEKAVKAGEPESVELLQRLRKAAKR